MCVMVVSVESEHVKTPKVLIKWLGKRDADAVVAKIEQIYAKKKNKIANLLVDENIG